MAVAFSTDAIAGRPSQSPFLKVSLDEGLDCFQYVMDIVRALSYCARTPA